MMNHWKRWRGFLLVWLVSSLLVGGYVPLALFLGGTPNWLDVLVFAGWAALASRWLGLVAERLQRRRVVRWVAIAVPPVALLVIAFPWALHLPVSGNLWRVSDAGRYFLSLADLTPRGLLLTIPQTMYIVQYLALDLGHDYLQGTAAITEHFQVARLSLALGLGLTALALSWCVTWQALLSTPVIVNLWTRLYNPVQRVWTGLRRTRAWYWLRRGLAWGMIILLILDGVGVLLTARPIPVEWEPVVTTGFPSGPPRSVLALTVGPDKSLYAGTYGGVFRSADDGRSWQAVNQGLPDLGVRALTVGPYGESIFAGTLGEGVFRSADRGETWQAVNAGLTDLDVSALAVGPDGESLYAGTIGGGVFRSADGGETWQAVNAGLPDLYVSVLAVGPDGESIFAGIIDGGVFRLAGGDETWQAVNAGLTDLDVSALAVGPDGESIFAGTLGGSVFRSADGGETWQAINAGLTDLAVLSLTVGPDENLYAGTYYGGVFRSADGGQTWQAVNAGLTDLDVWALAVGLDDSLYAGTDYGGAGR